MTATIAASQSRPAPMSRSSDSSEVAVIASARRAGVGAPESPMSVRVRAVAIAQMTTVMPTPMTAEPIASG